MKSISIAIIVLAIGSIMNGASISVKITKTTSWFFITHTSVLAILRSGAQNTVADIYNIPHTGLFGGLYEEIVDGVSYIKVDVSFRGNRQAYSLYIYHHENASMNVFLQGGDKTSAEANTNSDTISSVSASLGDIDCGVESKLKFATVQTIWDDDRLVLKIELACVTNTSDETDSEQNSENSINEEENHPLPLIDGANGNHPVIL